jgi:hypothetical protein
LALAISDIDILRGEHYEDYIWSWSLSSLQAKSKSLVYILP